ncbi:Isoleucine--tRNA ligase, mitochondrial [Plecturocebus cupreus]
MTSCCLQPVRAASPSLSPRWQGMMVRLLLRSVTGSRNQLLNPNRDIYGDMEPLTGFFKKLLGHQQPHVNTKIQQSLLAENVIEATSRNVAFQNLINDKEKRQFKFFCKQRASC